MEIILLLSATIRHDDPTRPPRTGATRRAIPRALRGASQTEGKRVAGESGPLLRSVVMTFEWAPLTKDDLEAWAELLAAIDEVDQVGGRVDADDLAEELANPLLDPVEGTLAAWESGRLVAYGMTMSRATAQPVHLMSLWGGVRPEYRRRGLGRHLLEWAIGNTPVLHERRFPGQPLELHVEVDSRNEGLRALVVGAGMKPARWFYGMSLDLGAELPEVSPPDGLRIVTYRDDLEDAVLQVRNRSFVDHWGSVQHTPESWRNSIVGVKVFRPESSFVALDAAGESVGVLLTHYFEADTEATGVREAWIQIIGTLREWRGRGVASALLAHALREFREQGYDKAGLGVDADNPTGAFGIYTRAGFGIERRSIEYTLPLGPAVT
ncbi:GNAT family N-acetyltransferase [Streptosporangium sp. NPDC000095]|uniref:GNAT family N-acetyltransferase n=1 Tax=Streptosporangium sp. NPDC000095 TaxID=3366184 RepID=UPI00367757AD